MGSPAPGFDRKLFDRLAGKIADAIEGAASDADKFSDMSTTLLLKEGRVTNLLRNRAPEPFMLNSDWKEVLAAGPAPAYPCLSTDLFVKDPYVGDCPRYNAVDERIAVLEIRRAPAGSIRSFHVASMVFLSVHPEAMPTSLMERSCFFPETIPVSLIRLKGTSGRSLSFGVLPGELTRTAWWRIEKLFDPDPTKPRDILPIGLANEYIGYVTTRGSRRSSRGDTGHKSPPVAANGPRSGSRLAPRFALIAFTSG